MSGHNIEIKQGATFSQVFQYTDSSGTPIDLTGWTVRGEIRSARDNASQLLETLSMTISNPAAGEITLNIPAARSSGYTWRRGFYDIELVAPDGATVIRLLEGVVRVQPEVTLG